MVSSPVLNMAESHLRAEYGVTAEVVRDTLKNPDASHHQLVTDLLDASVQLAIDEAAAAAGAATLCKSFSDELIATRAHLSSGPFLDAPPRHFRRMLLHRLGLVHTRTPNGRCNLQGDGSKCNAGTDAMPFHHAPHCLEARRRLPLDHNTSHNRVRDIIAKSLRKVGYTDVRTEMPLVGEQTMDIVFTDPFNARRHAIDFTFTHQSSVNSFVAAAVRARKRKNEHYLAGLSAVGIDMSNFHTIVSNDNGVLEQRSLSTLKSFISKGPESSKLYNIFNVFMVPFFSFITELKSVNIALATAKPF